MPRNMTPPIRHAEPELNDKLEKLFLASLSSGPDDDGHYATVTYNTKTKDWDEARKWGSRINRPRKWRKYLDKQGKMKYGLVFDIIKLEDGNYGVKFFATTRASALKAMMAKSEDPTKWAYSTNPDHPNYNS